MAGQFAAQLQAAVTCRRAGIGRQRQVAALAAHLFAIGEQRGPGRHVDPAAIAQRQVAAATQGNPPAVEMSSIGIHAALRLVAPEATRIQRHAIAQGQGGTLAGGGGEIGIDPLATGYLHLLQHVAQAQTAGARREVGVHLDLGRVQDDLAAIADLQGIVHRDPLTGGHAQRPQLETRQPFAVEQEDAPLFVGQRGIQVQVRRQRLAAIGQAHLLQGRRKVVQHVAAGTFVARGIAAHDQLGAARHCVLRLLVAIRARLRRAHLALALEYLAEQVALEHRRSGADHQAASIAADHVAALVTALRGDQRIVEIARLPPARAAVLIAAVDALVEQVAGGAGDFVETSVAALEPGLPDQAALHIEGPAGEVDRRAGLAHQLAAGEGQGAALGHPLAGRMVARAKVATQFQQAAGGIPAIGGVAVGAGRNQDQFAGIDPDIIAGQSAAVAVDRRVALLVALDIDLDVVAFHRHLHPDGAGDVHLRAVAQQAPARRADRHLAAAGQGQRAALEIHATAADDLDPRLLAAIGDPAEVVETTDHVVGRRGAIQRLLGGIALAVEGAGAAGVDQHRGGAALAQDHAAPGVAGRVEQVDGAAHVG